MLVAVAEGGDVCPCTACEGILGLPSGVEKSSYQLCSSDDYSVLVLTFALALCLLAWSCRSCAVLHSRHVRAIPPAYRTQFRPLFFCDFSQPL